MGIYSYGYKAGKKLLQKVFKPQQTTGTEVIKSFKPGTEFKGTPKYQKEIITAKSEVQKKFNPINEGIASETKKLKQKLQGMRGERITQSGISKGKDLVKKAKGGRVGLKFGSPNPRKSNVQKIKETFGPKKKLSTKQMKIAKLAGDPKRIDAPDFKKLRGKA